MSLESAASEGASLDPFAPFSGLFGDQSLHAEILNRSGHRPDGSIDPLEFFNQRSGFLRIQDGFVYFRVPAENLRHRDSA